MEPPTEGACRPSTRRLYPWEIDLLQEIFAGCLDYQAVRIHECSRWPDALDRLSRRLRRMPASGGHNAVTLGNHLFFPVSLPQRPPAPGSPEIALVAWLVHELAHAWQYQRLGWPYLWRAVRVQVQLKARAYDFGGEQGLQEQRQHGCSLQDFNLEQQGDILRTYYLRRCQGKDISAWAQYIDDIHSM